MRKINKLTPPDSFIRFMKSQPKEWNEIHTPPYRPVYEEIQAKILIEEQDCLCGYTELPLDDKGVHIDHFRKRDLFPEETFSWNNLIVALKNSTFGADYKDNGYKISKEEYALLINPATENAEDFFEYSGTGDIRPRTGLPENERLRAEKTITVFNLRHASLKNRRRDLFLLLNQAQGVTEEVVRSAFSFYGFKSILEQFLKERESV